MSKIINEYSAQPVMEGAGVLVNRVFGHGETTQFDPFLMLDYFETDKETNSPGFPWHPHRKNGHDQASPHTIRLPSHKDRVTLPNDYGECYECPKWPAGFDGYLHML